MSAAATGVLLLADPQPCGLGEGEWCCAFLVASSGFACGRTVPGIAPQIRGRLAAGTMNAKYDPGETPFPECQTSRPAGVTS